MAGEKWKIYWNEYSSDTYLYGSEIIFHKKDDVEFRNMLMPPGTIIKQWYSKTNYQMKRIEPALPMIDGEGAYQIEVDIDCPEKEAWQMRLVFYDKYDLEAGYISIRDKITDFKCPIKTYSYRMQLINGGMTEFHFHSVVIREIEDETQGENKKTEKNSRAGKALPETHGKAFGQRTVRNDREVQKASGRRRKSG